MIEHKAYECEFCGIEFDHDEYEEAVKHEKNCSCNPIHKKCGSCRNGKRVTSYEVEYIQCTKLINHDCSCNDWRGR